MVVIRRSPRSLLLTRSLGRAPLDWPGVGRASQGCRAVKLGGWLRNEGKAKRETRPGPAMGLVVHRMHGRTAEPKRRPAASARQGRRLLGGEAATRLHGVECRRQRRPYLPFATRQQQTRLRSEADWAMVRRQEATPTLRATGRTPRRQGRAAGAVDRRTTRLQQTHRRHGELGNRQPRCPAASAREARPTAPRRNRQDAPALLLLTCSRALSPSFSVPYLSMVPRCLVGSSEGRRLRSVPPCLCVLRWRIATCSTC